MNRRRVQKKTVQAAEKELSLDESEKELLHRWAEKVFGSRGDVLDCPGPSPEEDRYLAMLRLLQIARKYGDNGSVGLGASEATPDCFFFVTDKEQYASDCYDGGCGGIETDYFGVQLHLYPDPQAFPAENDADEFLHYDRVLARLKKPLGLSDSVLVSSHRE